MSVIVLLGPQRFEPSLSGVVAEMGIDGSIAAVTAGWQEREGEDQELRDHLAGRVVNLRLHARAEQVFAADGALFAALRWRQNRLKELQRLYRLRLDPVLSAARAMRLVRGEAALVEPERRAALEMLRDLDRHHLERVRAIHREHQEEVADLSSPLLAEHREELAEELAGCAALALAGGHVAVLLNRLRLFGILDLIAGRPIFAWSAGAMVLASRVVLFHDSPPQGAGNAEVLENGCDLLGDFLPLPHGGRRLRLDDPLRVELFARRFGPERCCTLDPGARVVLRRGRLVEHEGVLRLGKDGRVAPLKKRGRRAVTA
ncbi:MAG: hypothetical protein AAF604_22170 [Acidobacteriota bacterium]